MKILGIDYGLSKIGLAFAESELAEPLSVINNCSMLFEKIAKICQQYGVEKIVVGLPEGKLVETIKKFGQELSLVTTLPVVFQDETLTSQQAIVKMIAAGRGKKYRRTKSDAIAAALILQNYLDQNV